MTSYLGDYPGARRNPEQKFIRAVNSFINQTIGQQNCELVIVSDGCEITNRLFEEHYQRVSNISLIKMPKEKNSEYPGGYRQIGIDNSKYEYITYLDSDDFILPSRLKDAYTSIANSKEIIIIDEIYNMPNVQQAVARVVKEGKGEMLSKFNQFEIEFIKLRVNWTGGTYQLIHKKDIGVTWKSEGGRGEDYVFANEIYKSTK